MAIQYTKKIDIGKDRYEWLESHSEVLLPVMVRGMIDALMREAKA
jgi:hypothetical protein